MVWTKLGKKFGLSALVNIKENKTTKQTKQNNEKQDETKVMQTRPSAQSDIKSSWSYVFCSTINSATIGNVN